MTASLSKVLGRAGCGVLLLCPAGPLPATASEEAPAVLATGQDVQRWQPYTLELTWGMHCFVVRPGRRFDLILARSTPDGPRYKLLMEGIRVLAAEQQTGWSAVVTLRVTSAQAEQLNAARQQGKVHPILCPE